uniref:NAD-dependent epimerase/dehydratase family protein n=1 Tax=candidate division WOR-3 bacterium TaxID=2052148 RepID=A0A7C4CD49_UNCW3
MRILVTGAGGFVGTVLVPLLADRYGPAAVRLFVLPGERLPDEPPWPELAVFRGDIRMPESLRPAVSGCYVVVHLAGLISYRLCDRRRLFEVNARGAANVARVCIETGVSRLVHFSSTGAIGFRRSRVPATPATPYNWPGIFHYMASKRAGQEHVQRLCRKHGLDAVVLNPAAIMGPGDPNPESPHNRLYALVSRARVMPTFTGGLAVVDVRDVAAIAAAAIEAAPPAEPCLLVGANVGYSDVLRSIAAAMGRRIRLIPVPAVLLAGTGLLLESLPEPPLTLAYGLMSGWHCYYDGESAAAHFRHTYRSFTQTVADACRYYTGRFASG